MAYKLHKLHFFFKASDKPLTDAGENFQWTGCGIIFLKDSDFYTYTGQFEAGALQTKNPVEKIMASNEDGLIDKARGDVPADITIDSVKKSFKSIFDALSKKGVVIPRTFENIAAAVSYIDADKNRKYDKAMFKEKFKESLQLGMDNNIVNVVTGKIVGKKGEPTKEEVVKMSPANVRREQEKQKLAKEGEFMRETFKSAVRMAKENIVSDHFSEKGKPNPGFQSVQELFKDQKKNMVVRKK